MCDRLADLRMIAMMHAELDDNLQFLRERFQTLALVELLFFFDGMSEN